MLEEKGSRHSSSARIVVDGFERSSFSEGDDGCPACHRLNRDDSEILLRWEYECLRFTYELPDLLVRESESPFDVRLRSLAELPVEPVIGRGSQDEPFSVRIERIHEEVEPFVGDDSSDADEVVALRCHERELRDIDERIDDLRFPSVIFSDPILHIERVRNHVIRSLSCAVIPHPQLADGFRHDPPRKRIQYSEFKSVEIFEIMAPVVPCRCMAVADVHRSGLRDHSLALRRA